MPKRLQPHERRAKARKYNPRPSDEVTDALRAVGLNPDRVYALKRWDRGNVDLDRLGAAFHALTVIGWRVTSISAPSLRYPIAFQPPKPGAFPVISRDARAAQLRAEHERARGLAYVFDRSPEAIEIHLARHRANVAAVNADPIRRIASHPDYAGFLSRAELGALATFVSAFGKFHAAIGNASFTVAAGDGVPMTDEAREAAQAAYIDLSATIARQAGPRALSACQDLAANRSLPCRRRLKAASRAIDPAIGYSEMIAERLAQ
jgi:hypothetical protein